MGSADSSANTSKGAAQAIVGVSAAASAIMLVAGGFLLYKGAQKLNKPDPRKTLGLDKLLESLTDGNLESRTKLAVTLFKELSTGELAICDSRGNIDRKLLRDVPTLQKKIENAYKKALPNNPDEAGKQKFCTEMFRQFGYRSPYEQIPDQIPDQIPGSVATETSSIESLLEVKSQFFAKKDSQFVPRQGLDKAGAFSTAVQDGLNKTDLTEDQKDQAHRNLLDKYGFAPQDRFSKVFAKMAKTPEGFHSIQQSKKLYQAFVNQGIVSDGKWIAAPSKTDIMIALVSSNIVPAESASKERKVNFTDMINSLSDNMPANSGIDSIRSYQSERKVMTKGSGVILAGLGLSFVSLGVLTALGTIASLPGVGMGGAVAIGTLSTVFGVGAATFALSYAGFKVGAALKDRGKIHKELKAVDQLLEKDGLTTKQEKSYLPLKQEGLEAKETTNNHEIISGALFAVAALLSFSAVMMSFGGVGFAGFLGSAGVGAFASTIIPSAAILGIVGVGVLTPYREINTKAEDVVKAGKLGDIETRLETRIERDSNTKKRLDQLNTENGGQDIGGTLKAGLEQIPNPDGPTTVKDPTPVSLDDATQPSRKEDPPDPTNPIAQKDPLETQGPMSALGLDEAEITEITELTTKLAGVSFANGSASKESIKGLEQIQVEDVETTTTTTATNQVNGDQKEQKGISI